jgi:hypothetical protein
MLYIAGSIPVLLFAGVVGLVVNFSQLLIVIGISMALLFWWGIHYTRQAGEKENMPVETSH